jgi:hypothetical protein
VAFDNLLLANQSPQLRFQRTQSKEVVSVPTTLAGASTSSS